jgi:hypothetical protein
VRDDVNFISDPVKKITETGVVSADGTLREVDAIICATGFAGYAVFQQVYAVGLVLTGTDTSSISHYLGKMGSTYKTSGRPISLKATWAWLRPTCPIIGSFWVPMVALASARRYPSSKTAPDT